MKKIIKEFIPFAFALGSVIYILSPIMNKSKKCYIVIAMALLIWTLLKVLRTILRHSDNHYSFKSMINDLIRTYGFILTPIKNIPELRNYTYYKYDKFEQILDRAMDARVNIYYTHTENTYDFFLIDQGNLYVFTLKEQDKLFSNLDKYFIGIQYQR